MTSERNDTTKGALNRLIYIAIHGCYPSCPAQWGNFDSEKNSQGLYVIQGGHIAACPNTYPRCEYCGELGHRTPACPDLPKRPA